MAGRAIIFDCDGTLVETEVMSARIDVAYFAEHGIAFNGPEDYLAQFMGVAKKDVVRILNERHGASISSAHFQDVFTERMLARIPDEMGFFPESVDLVRGLAAQGIPLAVASNGQRAAVLAELRHAGYLDIIGEDRVLAVSDVANPKPAPDMYIEAARRLGVDPAECIVVEDSAPGARAGVAAGATVIGYTGFAHDAAGTEAALKKAGCAYVINRLSEISGFVAEKGLYSSQGFAKTSGD